MALYDTRFGLPQSVADYLNQGLPSISGIFSNVPTTTTPVVDDTTTNPVIGLTPEQLRLLYPQTGGGDGDGEDKYRGGGKFGNLDLSRLKTFTKDIYDEEEGDFVPTELTAYYNPTLGNYQTFEGKNINSMFSNTGLPTFGLGTLAMKMFGLEPKTVGGYVPGSIRGFYDSPKDLFDKNKNIQRQTTKQKADIQRVQRDIDSGKYNGGGGGGGDRPDRNRSSVTKSSAAKSKGVGGGGYTKSDSTRESYRGRY